MAKYVVHLPSGGTLDIESSKGVAGRPWHDMSSGGWRIDDNGVMINLAAVVAIVPVTEAAAPEQPAWIIDNEGDRFELNEDGTYRMLVKETGTFGHLPCTYEEIKTQYGIRERG